MAIIIPVLDDWNSLSLLLPLLDQNLNHEDLGAELLIVDDGSSLPFDEAGFLPENLENIQKVTILVLKRNLGHQRAIAMGLSYVAAELESKVALVMDGDGEDRPADIKLLFEKCRESDFSKVVFAKRSKRSEGFLFRFFYLIYTNFFQILTGQNIRFGNFSIVPQKIMRRLVAISEVWNHYAVGTMKARVPYEEIDTERGNRLSGTSKMNFVSLVTHGLSAISVYGEIAGVRLLLGTCILIVLSLTGVLIVVIVRIVTDLAIPGWATYVVAMLMIILMQAVTLSLFFIFLILNNRNSAGFLPERDYHFFISDILEIYRKK